MPALDSERVLVVVSSFLDASRGKKQPLLLQSVKL